MSTVLTAVTSCWQLLQAVDSCYKLSIALTAITYLIEKAVFCLICREFMHFLTYFLQVPIMRWCPKIDNYEVCFESLSQIKKKTLLEWKFQTTASNSITFKRGHEYTWLPFTAALQGPEGFCAFSAFSYHEGQFISLSETTWVLLRAVCFLEEIQMCGMCIWGNFARHGIRVGSGVDEVNMR